MRRFPFLCSCLLALTLLLTGCKHSTSGPVSNDPEAAQEIQRYLESMDTMMRLTAYGSAWEEALDAAEAEILRLDALLSTGQADSEISTLNRSGGGVLSPDVCTLVERSLELYEETDGAFNITIYPLMELWGFPSQDYHVSTEQELAETLSLVGKESTDFWRAHSDQFQALFIDKDGTLYVTEGLSDAVTAQEGFTVLPLEE